MSDRCKVRRELSRAFIQARIVSSVMKMASAVATAEGDPASGCGDDLSLPLFFLGAAGDDAAARPKTQPIAGGAPLTYPTFSSLLGASNPRPARAARVSAALLAGSD